MFLFATMLTEVHEKGADSAGGLLYDVEKANFTFDDPMRQAKHVSCRLSFFDLTTHDIPRRVAMLSCWMAWMPAHLMVFWREG